MGNYILRLNRPIRDGEVANKFAPTIEFRPASVGANLFATFASPSVWIAAEADRIWRFHSFKCRR